MFHSTRPVEITINDINLAWVVCVYVRGKNSKSLVIQFFGWC